jgi:hypothetical protein
MKILTHKMNAQYRWGFSRIYIPFEKKQHDLEKFLTRKKLRLLVNCFNLWKGVAKNSHISEKDFNIRQKNVFTYSYLYMNLILARVPSSKILQPVSETKDLRRVEKIKTRAIKNSQRNLIIVRWQTKTS